MDGFHNVVGKVQARIISMKEVMLEPKRILLSPDMMMALQHDILQANTHYDPRDIGGRYFYGIPVLVVRDIRDFEVSC